MKSHQALSAIAVAAMLGFGASWANAADAPAARYPCEEQEGFRDFDFWLGEWDVYTTNGQLATTAVKHGPPGLKDFTRA